MMRFEYYHDELYDAPKLSVDGLVPNSVHLSHWQGNQTPAPVKADSSTEIALNLVASPHRKELTKGIELVTNNHFDTDGALSVWTMLQGERALELRERLISAAESGDFSAYTSEDGIRASIVIQGSEQPIPGEDSGSPLARYLSGGSTTDEARLYEIVLPHVERVLTETGEYESLWQAPWKRIETAIDSFERCESAVEEYQDEGLSLIVLAPGAFGEKGLDPARDAFPLTAISRYARGKLFAISTAVDGGWVYRLDYPYYSWAETVVRPRIERRDLSSLVSRLNLLERGLQGKWRVDQNELASAAKFTALDGLFAASSLSPEKVADEMRTALREMDVAGMNRG